MSDHPATYKVAQIQEKGGEFKLVDVAWKDPAAGQVAVKTLACGVCHSDGAVVHQLINTGLPRVPGHEIVGTVMAVGPGEKHWKVGDRVGSGWHGGHCGWCKSCLRGDVITCAEEQVNGISQDGGYGEYVLLRSEALLSIPEDLDPAEVAPSLCAGVTTFNSLRNMAVFPGDVVAVQGIGGLGHLAIQYAQKMGFKTVAISTSAAKEQLARDLGADEYIDSSQVDPVKALQKLGGAKVIICNAPSGKAMSDLLPGLKVSGTLLVLGLADPLSIDITTIVSKRLSVIGWPGGSPIDIEETIAFARLAGVKTHVEKYPLEQVNEAYQSMATGKVRFRAVLTF